MYMCDLHDVYLHDLQRLDLAAAQLLDLGVFLALERLLGAADALLYAGLQLPLLVLQPLDDLARLLEMIHRCRQPTTRGRHGCIECDN